MFSDRPHPVIERLQEMDMDDRDYRPTRSIVTVYSADLDTLCRVEGAFFSRGKQVTVDRRGTTATTFFGPQSITSFQRGMGIFT